MAGRGPDEGRLKRPPGSGRSFRFPVRTRKHGRPSSKKRHKWSAGRRACWSHSTRHLRKVPDYDVAPFGAPLPHACEGQENEGAAPRLTTSGADESCLQGCLKTESENTRREPLAPASFRGVGAKARLRASSTRYG